MQTLIQFFLRKTKKSLTSNQSELDLKNKRLFIIFFHTDIHLFLQKITPI